MATESNNQSENIEQKRIPSFEIRDLEDLVKDLPTANIDFERPEKAAHQKRKRFSSANNSDCKPLMIEVLRKSLLISCFIGIWGIYVFYALLLLHALIEKWSRNIIRNSGKGATYYSDLRKDRENLLIEEYFIPLVGFGVNWLLWGRLFLNFAFIIFLLTLVVCTIYRTVKIRVWVTSVPDLITIFLIISVIGLFWLFFPEVILTVVSNFRFDLSLIRNNINAARMNTNELIN